MRRALAAMALTVAVACGGSSPTGPGNADLASTDQAASDGSSVDLRKPPPDLTAFDMAGCGIDGDPCTLDTDCCTGLACSDTGACAVPMVSCAGPGTPCAHSGECCDGLWCDGAACTASPSGCLPSNTQCAVGGTPCCDQPATTCDPGQDVCCIQPNNDPATIRCMESRDCCHGTCSSTGVCEF